MTNPEAPKTALALKDQKILFVTGRLAEGLTRQVVGELSEKLGFRYEIEVLGISVAALMHSDWVARKLSIHGEFDRVILPGWCQGEFHELEQKHGIPFFRGPKDIRDLGVFLGAEQRPAPDLKDYDIEILGELNHAPFMSDSELVRQALAFKDAGADLIDVGCVPGGDWTGVKDAVRRLIEAGCRVSIDSFNRDEVEAALSAGAELVLSCNRQNVEWAAGLGKEFVVIPDDPAEIETMWETQQLLKERGCNWRLDPILEPIGFGFAASLGRYQQARQRDPEVEMMMGIGNVTELSDVDSAGLNFLLAAYCQELRINSVLTTQVIQWSCTAIAEFDRARRLVKHAIDHRTPPKRLSTDLVMLRDPRVSVLGEAALQSLAGQLKDPNYRIFVERGEIHIMNRNGYWRGTDPYELFDEFNAAFPETDASHAFYLGYELSKAVTALTLNKQYRQDESLHWGFLTIPEISAHDRRKKKRLASRGGEQ